MGRETPHPSDKGPRFRRSILRVAALALPTVILICAIELGLRIFDPLGLSYFAQAHKYFATAMQPSDEYSYIHKPGFRGKFQGADVAINSAGFRGPEIETANTGAKIRVLIIGDSVVFGWGAPQSSIFPIRLQGMLEREAPEVEVIPAGVGSWNTRSEYEYLRSEGIQLGPEVIVLLITANDMEPHPTGRTEVARDILSPPKPKPSAGKRFLAKMWNGAGRRSYLLSYVQYSMRKRRATRAEAQVDTSSPAWEDARLALDGIVRLSRDTGAILIPYLYGSKETIEKNAVLRLYRDHLEASGFDYFTLPPEILTERRLHNSVIDLHPNADGHALIAGEMCEALLPVLAAVKSRKNAEAE